MRFKFAHNNLNVRDLDKSLAFYEEALGLRETRRIEPQSGEFIIVYLTWLRDFDRAYDLGDNEFHLAFTVDDFDAALVKHKEMNCVCFENPAMGIYFINDPDGYWLEVLPVKG